MILAIIVAMMLTVPLFAVYLLVYDRQHQSDGERTARTGCVDTKKLLADRIIRHYAPARERYHELMADPAEVEGILEAGADRLKPMAKATIDEVHRKMGLR